MGWLEFIFGDGVNCAVPGSRELRKLAMGTTYCALLLLLLAVSLHVDGLEVEPLEGDARLGVWWDPVVPDPAWVPVRNL